MNIDVAGVAKKVIESTLDDVTKVHLCKILDAGPTTGEMFLINQLLEQNRRHKFVDSPIRPNSNPP